MEFKHIPVLLNECIDGLNISSKGIYVDCTLGGAGHSEKILEKLTTGKLIGIDRDLEAIEASKKRLEKYKDKVIFIHDNYKNIKQILIDNKIEKVDGILCDLGISSYQIDNPNRGFSINNDGKIDMRMDTQEDFSAFDVVNKYSLEKLTNIIKNYGEEPFAYKIASKIVSFRKDKVIETTKQLKDIIESCFPKKLIYKIGNVSQKTFQAIRIEVNKELENLDKCFNDFIDCLKIGGRCCIISFHSLEDRIVKSVFSLNSKDCICPPKTPICICNHKAKIKLINKKPITASKEECDYNSRSTCAKLRIVEKII